VGRRRELRAIKGTLIVTPATILYQWVSEMEEHTPSLRVLVYAGAKADAGVTVETLAAYDVVLTTYVCDMCPPAARRPPPAWCPRPLFTAAAAAAERDEAGGLLCAAQAKPIQAPCRGVWPEITHGSL
jgi:hypothetical protein